MIRIGMSNLHIGVSVVLVLYSLWQISGHIKPSPNHTVFLFDLI